MTTQELKTLLAKYGDTITLDAILASHDDLDGLEIVDLQKPANWKRLRKFRRSSGEVVRYFALSTMVSEDGEPIEPVAKVVTDGKDEEVVDVFFGACREPSEVVFDLQHDEEYGTVVCATLAPYLDMGYMDDQSLATPYMPPRWEELSEGMYRPDKDEGIEKTRETLEKLGYRYQEMARDL